jgi:translation initiation factor 2 gamma subunit (eIF-2gamma)
VVEKRSGDMCRWPEEGDDDDIIDNVVIGVVTWMIIANCNSFREARMKPVCGYVLVTVSNCYCVGIVDDVGGDTLMVVMINIYIVWMTAILVIIDN